MQIAIYIYAILYMVFVMGYKLSNIVLVASIVFLSYKFIPESVYKQVLEQVLEHPTFKKIYPGYDKLLNFQFLIENKVYLSYYLAILGIIIYIFLRVRRVYLGVSSFFGDVSSELGLLCNSRTRFIFPLLIPLYNPIFLICFLLPLRMLLYRLGSINSNSNDPNEMDKKGNEYLSKAFYVYYTVSVLYLYIVMFRACRTEAPPVPVTEAPPVTEELSVTEAPPITATEATP
jgi:hypothetical protein